MKKYLLTLCSVLLLGILAARAQYYAPVNTIEQVTGCSSSAVVPLRVKDFNNIGALDLKISFDNSIASLNQITFGPGVSFSSWAVNSAQLLNGIIDCGGFFNLGTTLAEDAVLLYLHFDRVSAGTSPLLFIDDEDSYGCLYYDYDYNALTDTPKEDYYIDGSVTFYDDANAPITTVPQLTACPGQTIAFPVTVTQFCNVGAGSFTLNFDSGVLTNPVFDNTSNVIPFDVNTETPGTIRISGFSSQAGGHTLPDGSVLFTISFTYSGGTSALSFNQTFNTTCQYGGSTPLYTPLLDAPKSTYFIDGGITPIDPPVMTCPTYDPVLVTAEPFALSGASPSGGTYSGTGVSQSGDSFLFDPATAGVGTHSITYSYNYGPSGQELVAYWSFNELNISGTTFPVNGDQPLNIAPTSGTGNLSLTGWGGGVTSLAGSILNVVNSDPAGNALSLSNFMNIVTGNNTYIQIQTSLLNLTDPVITFATNRNSAGYTTGTWSYSIDGINFIPWVGNTAPAGSNFELQTVDFSGVSELTNASTVYFRYTLNGSTAANGNNLIDNLQINATEVSNCIATCQFTITVTEEVLINCPDDFAVCQTDEEFELTGAIPAGGSYEGVGVSYTSPKYFFSPSGAGPGVHTITYYPDPLDQTRFCTFDITVEATPVPGTLTKSPDLLEVCEGLGVSATFTPGTGGNGIDELEYRTTADGTTWGDWASYISGTSIPSAGIGGVEIRTRRLAYGCLPSGYNTVAWTVNPLPTITITTSDYQCSGRTLANRDYSATTGDPNLYMLDWDDAANTEGFLDVSYTALPTNPQAIGLIIPEDAEPGIYYATLMVKNSTTGCESTGYTISLTLEAPPVFTVQPSPGSQNVCQNGPAENLTVTVTEGDNAIGTYEWFSNTSASTSGSTPVATHTSSLLTDTYTPVTTSAGTLYYYCVVTDAHGCQTWSEFASVTINANPSAPVSGGDQTICANETIPALTVTVGVGETADWYSLASGGTVLATATTSYTPTAAGTYYAQSRNTTTGCVSTSRTGVTLTINANPSAPVSGGDQTICANETIPALTVTVGVGETADWYSLASGGTALATATTSYTPTAAGTYYAQSRNTTTGCVSTSRTGVTLTINANPSAPVSGGDQTICANETIPALTVTVGVGETADWYSLASGGTALATATTSYTPTAAGTYYAQSRNTTTGCVSTSRTGVTLTINANPSAPVSGGDQTICANETIPALTVTVGVGETADWYSLASGGTALATATTSYTPTAAGTYYAQSRNTTTGCVSTSRTGVTLTINANPSAPVSGGDQTICANETIPALTVTVGVGETADWYSLASGGTALATATTSYTPTAAGTYYAQSRNTTTGCVSTSRTGVTLTINANPSAPVSGGDQTICANETIPALTVTVGVGETADWYAASSGGTALVTGTLSYTPTAAGTYYAEVRNTGTGCVSTTRTAVTLTINANPTAPSVGTITQPTCSTPTGSVILSGLPASGSWTLTRTPGGTTYTGSGTTYTVTGLPVSTTYTFTVTNSNNCVSTSSANVVIDAIPGAPVLGGATAVCAGLTANVTPATAGTWSSSNTAVATITDGGLVTGVSAGNVTLTYTRTADGCSNTMSFTVNANPSAPVSGGDQTICANETIPALTVTVGTGETADWYSLASGGTALATATTSYTPTAAGTYYAQSRNTTTGCVSTSRTGVTLTINANPSAPVSGGDQTICANETIPALTVTVGVGETADWYSLASGGTVLATATTSYTPTAAGTYYAQSRNTTTGCVSTSRTGVTLTINANPSAPVSGGDQTICANETIPALTVTVGVGETADWYSVASGGTALATATTSYTPTAAGTYYAQSRNTTTGCVSTSRTGVTLTINANPSAPVSGGDQTICANETIPALTVTVGVGETADWYSVASGGTALATATTSYTPTAAGTYYAQSRNTTTGCVSTSRTGVTLTINALPVVYAGADQTIPNGTSTTISDATATGTAPLTYAWTPAASFVDPGILHPTTVILKVNTTFTLTVTDANGCQSSDQVLVTVSGGPLSVSPVADPVALCLGESTTLSAQANGGSASYTYSWTSVPEGFVSTMANPAAVPEETTTYKVEVYDGYTAVSGEVTVTVNPLPDPLIFAGDMSSACPGETITLTAQSSLNFDGSSTRYVQVPNYSGLNVGNLTLEAWVYPTYYGGIRNVFFKGDHQYYLQIRNGYVYFGSRNAAGAPLEEFQGSMLLPLNQWSHIAVTHDGTLRRLYVNGIPDPVISGQAGLFTGDPNGAKIGAHFFDIPNENFNGIIDELRVWSVARSAEDLASNMHREVDAGSPGLSAYFRLNEGSGGTTFNLVSPTNSGVLVNDPEWVTPTDVPISYSYSWSTGETSQSIGVTSNDIYTLEVTDLFGCTASTSVEVALVDVEKPTISCPGEIALSVDVDKCTASGVALGIPTVNDNCTLPANAVTNNAPAEFLLGNTTVIWTVTDGAGLTATCSQLVTVTDNQKPTITCPSDPQNKSITSPLTAYTAVGTEFDATATDNCGTVTLTNSLNSLSTLAGYDFPVGTTTVTWYAADEAGNSMSCTFSVIVTLDNTAPVANNDTYTVEEDGSVILTPLANDTDADSDPLSIVSINGTALTGSAQTITVSNGTVNISSSGVITFIPSPDYFGTVTFPYMITDGVVNAAASISVTVTAVNDSPVLAAIGNKIVDELTTLTFTAMATDVDLPAENLTFSLIGAPAGATIDPTTGAFSWTPTEAQGPGTYTVTVKVCDNGTPSLCDEETITITVVEISCPEDFAVCQIDGEVELTGGTPAGGSYEGDGVSYTSPAYLFSPSGAGPGVHTITYYPDPEDQTRYCTFDITVEATPVPGTLTKSPDLNAVCEGTGVSATLTPGTGGNGTDELEYRTTADGTTWGDWASYISGTSIPSAGIGGVEIRTRRLADECDPSGYNSVAWTVVPNLPVSVAIAADPTGAICSGTSVTFTATPTNGGTTPAYQWKLNGVDVGTGAATYTNAALVNGDKVTCVLTSSETCTTGSPATSNEIAMTVNPNLPVSVAIAADPTGAICSGTSVTFTATPTNGGTTPAYQWKLNGVDVGTGAATYTNAALVNGDKVTCVLTSSETCTTGSPATSNEIAMTVNPNLPVSVAIAADPTGAICSGTSVTFTATPTNGGTTPAYQWKLNGVDVGTGAATYTNAALVNGDKVTCVLTSSETCTTGSPATSNEIAMTVNLMPELTSIAYAGSPFCSNEGTALVTLVGDAGGTYVSTPSGLSMNAATGALALATSIAGTYTVTYTIGATGGCPAVSASTQITINPLPTAFAGADKSIPYGTSVTLADATATGTAPLTYAWTPAASFVDPSILHPTTVILEANTTFTLTVTDANGCQSSDQVLVTVTGGPLSVSPVADPVALCLGESTTLSAQANGGSASYTYSWTSVPEGFTSISANPVVTPLVTTVYSVVVNDGFNSVSGTVTVTVNDLPVANVTGPLSIPYGTATAITTAIASGTEPLTYSWEPSALLVDPSVLNPVTKNIYSPTVFTLTVTDANGCSASSVISILMEPSLSPIGGQTVNELSDLEVTLSAYDTPGATTLTFSLVDAPEGMTIANTGIEGDKRTGLLSWTPTEAQGPGTYTITVQVCDDGTPPACDQETILITVGEVNAAPVLASIGNKTVEELGTLTFTATATDGDVPADNLTFSLTGAPAGATIDPVTGAFNWSPTEAQGPGTYTITVQVCDDGTPPACDTETILITVTESTPLSVTLKADPILCNGGTTQVVVTAEGGVAPYSGTGNFLAEAGTHTYVVTDSEGNVATGTITLTEPEPLVAKATAGTIQCYGETTSVVVEATGGTLPYQGTGTFIVEGGIQEFLITDANGCTATVSVTVQAPSDPLFCMATVNQQESLTGAADGEAMVIADGGWGDYSYLWSNGQTTAVATGLTAGTYTVTVTDAQGCSSKCEVLMTIKPSIYGNVFHDFDRMTDNTVDGYGINPEGLLYVNLLDGSGIVLASQLVNVDGTFSFRSADAGNYTVQISVNGGVPGEAMPLTALPVNWIHTGEHQGAGPGSDGTADGLISIFVDGNSDLVQVNFGVVKLPDVTVTITASPNVMNGVTDFDVILKVTEVNGVNTNGSITVLIPKDLRWGLKNGFDQALTFLGGSHLDNNKWTFNGSDPDYLEFVCNEVLPGDHFITLGFKATFDPGATRGVYTITSQLSLGSGGENRYSNNSDSEKLDYFSK